MAEPILIWGAGAIGGTLGAYWARAGREVLLVDIDSEHVAACHESGLSIEGPVDSFSVPVPAVTPDELRGCYARIVLAVKAHHTAAAVTALQPFLADDGFVLSAQNGLNEREIARQIGDGRTIGAFVNFGADRMDPGHVLFGNRGAVVIGELDGRVRPRTEALFALFREFEPDAILTDNIWGFLWGKLAYGAMLFATALTMDSMTENFADPQRFVVWRCLASEVMAVAAASGVTPEGFDGFDPASFAASASDSVARRSVADLAIFNRGSAKTHSGVWRDLAVHSRRTEVDAQIAVISALGREVGVETPGLRCLVSLVHEVEAGERPQGMETFMELVKACS